MLYSKAAGPGDSSPSPSTYHILGSSRHGFAHLHYIVGVQFLQPFSRFFAVFRPFLHHFLHFWPPGPTCRAELGTGTQNQGAGNHKTPWVGAKKKPRAGRGGRPRTAQRRGGGRPSAPIPGAERRPAPEGGGPAARGGGDRRERAADRRQGSTAARAASGRGGPPQRGDALPAKKGGALRRPAAYRRCPARLCRTGQAGGGCGPPQSAEPAGPNAATPPRDGGGPPPPGPTLQVCTGAANNALAPRPQVADGGIA
jgi:hypothetical protein